MINERVTTVTLTSSTVTELEFNQRNGCCCYFIKNDSNVDAYASVNPDCTADANGTFKISSGEACGTGSGNNKLYLSGDGKVQVVCTNDNVNPFKSGGKGVDIVTCAQSEYDSMPTHNPNTYYYCYADPAPALQVPATQVEPTEEMSEEMPEVEAIEAIDTQPVAEQSRRGVVTDDL